MQDKSHGWPRLTFERRIYAHNDSWPDRWEALTGIRPNVVKGQPAINAKDKWRFKEKDDG